MINVIARDGEDAAVREFFELFKTPWRYHQQGLEADALLCVGWDAPVTSAQLILIYDAEENSFDRQEHLRGSAHDSGLVSFGATAVPLYRPYRTFEGAISVAITREDQTFVRIGYDLFGEIEHLLKHGQPRTHALSPTLELHIKFLRELLIRHGIAFNEVPPIPQGYRFIACLTHDIDHPGIRFHRADATMWGFLFRALVWSWVEVIRGRLSFPQLVDCYGAALSLPLVHLRLVRDPWDNFGRYLEIERGLGATYFVVPRKGDPGGARDGEVKKRRATAYGARDISDTLHQLRSAGAEIGVHGIDAWRGTSEAKEELEHVAEAAGQEPCGIRMHWLFFDEESPARLEEAGYLYDSTWGYNDAVGYRAGTMQIYKPLQAKRLLELPLHVMDTALFYWSYLNLTHSGAWQVLEPLLDNAEQFGGVLTINWHDRSLAPERCWDEFYVELVDELKRRGAWIPTAAEAVAWFKERRDLSLEELESDGAFTSRHTTLPPFQIHRHRSSPGQSHRLSEVPLSV